MVEIGNALSRARWRALGYATILDLRADPDIEVMPADAELFERALSLYGARMDKEWGMTDCMSFVVMQERDLTQVLTTDRHFGQAGFVDLLTNFPRHITRLSPRLPVISRKTHGLKDG